MSGAALAIGPLIGGALVDGLGWEWIFWLNLPIGAALWAATRLRLGESSDPDPAPVDLPGVATSGAGSFLLLLALIRGNDEGWGSPQIVAALVAAAVLLAAFVVVELRRARPMLDVRLFRDRAFAMTADGLLRPVGGDLPDVPVPRPLLPGRAGPHPVRDRPAAAAGHGRAVRGRADRRAASPAGCRCARCSPSASR